MTKRLSDDELREWVNGLSRNGDRESQILEFKEQVPDAGERNRVMQTICAFANTHGGTIVVGIEERVDENGKKTGEAGKICGLGTENTDVEIRALEQSIQTSIDPPVPGIQPRLIRMAEGCDVYILEVPKSQDCPHRLSSGHFYIRNTLSNRRMTREEVKLAMSGQTNDNTSARVGQHAQSRAAYDNAFVPLQSKASAWLHIIPETALDGQIHVEPYLVYPLARCLTGEYGGESSITAEGLLVRREAGDSGVHFWYCLLANDGIIEVVDCRQALDEQHERVDAIGFVRFVLGTVSGALHAFRQLSVSSPFHVCASLIGIKAYTVSAGRYEQAFMGSRLSLPGAFLSTSQYGVEVESALRPMFDRLWNAAGSPSRSLNNSIRSRILILRAGYK